MPSPKGFISYNVRGVEEVQAFLRELPRGGIKATLGAMVEYFIGNSSHGLKHYEPYKYVTRKRAYGHTFSSDKQRRYVMAKIASGEITPGRPNRSGATAAGWQYAILNDQQYRITNPTAGAYYTRGEPGQARLNALVGWRVISKVVADNLKGAIRAGVAALKAWIAQKGKK